MPDEYNGMCFSGDKEELTPLNNPTELIECLLLGYQNTIYQILKTIIHSGSILGEGVLYISSWQK